MVRSTHQAQKISVHSPFCFPIFLEFLNAASGFPTFRLGLFSDLREPPNASTRHKPCYDLCLASYLFPPVLSCRFSPLHPWSPFLPLLIRRHGAQNGIPWELIPWVTWRCLTVSLALNKNHLKPFYRAWMFILSVGDHKKVNLLAAISYQHGFRWQGRGCDSTKCMYDYERNVKMEANNQRSCTFNEQVLQARLRKDFLVVPAEGIILEVQESSHEVAKTHQ